MSLKTCKWCKQKFTPSRLEKICCSVECETEYALKLISRQEHNVIASSRTIKVKRISDYRKDAQCATNAFVRADEKDLPCISCGTYEASAWHAGHYRAVNSHPELRYERLNIHKQCSRCNTHLHGNLIEYRKGLLARYGPETVDWLEGPHDQKKYTISDLIEIRDSNKLKLKELKNG